MRTSVRACRRGRRAGRHGCGDRGVCRRGGDDPAGFATATRRTILSGVCGRPCWAAWRATRRGDWPGLPMTKVDIINNAQVWGLFPDPTGAGWQLAVDTPIGPQAITADTVILAPGAYDRPIPFPGWTLPGVLTAGAVQTLLKGPRVSPGRRVLLSGTGPLQIAAAAELVQAGAEVVAVLEAAHITWRAGAPSCRPPGVRDRVSLRAGRICERCDPRAFASGRGGRLWRRVG